ncbi:Uncharacterised protein [Acinetobacter baumannii]|nr:Uncharacterised protein [Acinetobacter baumannii]
MIKSSASSVRRRDFTFAERLPLDEALDSFQQREYADFIPYFHDFAHAAPNCLADRLIKFKWLVVHLSPDGIWDYDDHVTGFYTAAV